jgi:beta-lactam-binding protein with PASTA domain/predicted Ser/Thr protein kinase
MNSEARLVGGRYEEGDPLGRGGMADVRKGIDNRLGRTVAIKRLRVDLASDSTFQARFRREAQSAASLNHPTIVSVYDTGEEPDPNGTGITIPYIVMEYVAGKTLRDLIREGRKIMPERALEMTSGVLEALDYSHRAGIVHRDIKPGNVMLTPQGQVKVMDFGIARAVADTSSTMTQTAAVIGTAQYLSPEQARGETVDARSDLYSTGCLLYELLVGRPPFVGESPVSVAYQHVREEPAPPSSFDPDIPPEVDAVVLKALTKDREHRYQSAAEMRADVHRVLAGQQVTAPMAAVAETRPIGSAVPAGVGAAAATREADPINDLLAEDRDPQSAAARRNRGLAYFLLGLAIVAVAIGGYLIWDNANGKGDAGTTQVAVPNLINKTYAQAKSELNGLGLNLADPQYKFTTAFKAGTVMDQKPGGATMVDPGTTVTVTLSRGAQVFDVPDVIGMKVANARKAIEDVDNANFQVEQKNQVSDEPFGEVIDVSPSTSEKHAANTVFTLTVSSGPAKVALPKLVGMDREQAEQEITKAGLKLGNVQEQETSDADPNTVIRQSPEWAEGKQVEKNSTVDLWVAKEPQGEPSPTPTPTPTDTPTVIPTEPTTPPITISGTGGRQAEG